jgi:hypothetical protein
MCFVHVSSFERVDLSTDNAAKQFHNLFHEDIPKRQANLSSCI